MRYNIEVVFFFEGGGGGKLNIEKEGDDTMNYIRRIEKLRIEGDNFTAHFTAHFNT